MPVEAARLRHPIGRRDRRLLAVLACAAALGGPAAVLALDGSDAPPADGCARVIRPGFMGGVTVRDCSAKRYPSSGSRSATESTMREGR
jgi:hypothetical protein